jgi:hypothetical protein
MWCNNAQRRVIFLDLSQSDEGDTLGYAIIVVYIIYLIGRNIIPESVVYSLIYEAER